VAWGDRQASQTPKFVAFSASFERTEIRVSRVGSRAILEPLGSEDAAMPWAELDRLGDRPIRAIQLPAVMVSSSLGAKLAGSLTLSRHSFRPQCSIGGTSAGGDH